MIINAFITNAKRPSVITVRGSENNTTIGLTKALTNPSANATQIADQKFFNSTPLNMRDAI